jgi:hypothetical protein
METLQQLTFEKHPAFHSNYGYFSCALRNFAPASLFGKVTSDRQFFAFEVTFFTRHFVK